MTEVTRTAARPIAVLFLLVGLAAGVRLVTMAESPPASAADRRAAAASGDLACALFKNVQEEIAQGGATWTSLPPNHLYRIYQEGMDSADPRLARATSRLYGDDKTRAAFRDVVEETSAACAARR